MNHVFKNLIYPYQCITAIKPRVYRVGLTDIIKNRIDYDFCVNDDFKYFTKKKNTKVSDNEISCTIYNLNTEMYYLFYSPYNGKIKSINYNLLNNMEHIRTNNEKDNWLFDVEIPLPYKYCTYY